MARKKKLIQVEELLALSLPADADRLADLPHPGETALASAPEEQCREAVGAFRSLWIELLSNSSWKPTGSAHEVELRRGGSGGFWAVLRMVGTYFGFSLFRYAEKAGQAAAADLIRGSIPDIRDDIDEDDSLALIRDIQRLHAHNMLMAFEICAWGLFIATMLDEVDFQPGELTEEYDSDLTANHAFARFHEHSVGLTGDLRSMADALLQLALDYRRDVIKRRAERRRETMQRSGTAITSRELVLLAGRHSFMTKKYGTKRAERVFEQQISLVLQELGFTVVPVRPGATGADLICISRERRFSFLVDAKTSGRSYNLPKDDQRALADYVEEYSVDLPDLPPLAFVLLVGYQAAKTLPRRLVDLEARAGVPVRFMQAGLLARLRDGISGPVSPSHFRDAVIRSEPVLGEEVLRKAKEAEETIAAAYKGFVENLRKAAG